MAGKADKPKRVRLFVALDLPAAVRAAIEGWGDEQLFDPALRRVGEESLHVTLAFLGPRPPEQVEPVAAVVRECGVSPAPLLELLEVVGRPTPRRARFWALPLLSPGAEQLAAEVGGRLTEAGLYEPEKRPFWPHVTVARVRAESRGSKRPMLVEQPPEGRPEGASEPFLGVRLTLYRSELQPSGARYVPLAQVELPGGGWQ